MDLPSALKEGK